jgi:hypothetical protein
VLSTYTEKHSFLGLQHCEKSRCFQVTQPPDELRRLVQDFTSRHVKPKAALEDTGTMRVDPRSSVSDSGPAWTFPDAGSGIPRSESDTWNLSGSVQNLGGHGGAAGAAATVRKQQPTLNELPPQVRAASSDQ